MNPSSLVLAGALCAVAGCASPGVATQRTVDNRELAQLYDEDQSDRTGTVDWQHVGARDAARRARVQAMLQDGALRTAHDYLHAAMIFQHGTQFGEVRLAQALAVLAMTIDPHDDQARWLTAASFDRMLTYRHQLQWYGTQYSADTQGVYLYPTAAHAVTDADRTELRVPTLAEAQHQVQEMADANHLPVRASAPTLDELQAGEEHP